MICLKTMWLVGGVSEWATYEIILRDASGEYAITPFSDALAVSGQRPAQAINKMRMVQEIGWPEAKRSFTDQRGRPLIVGKEGGIWLLKCKPLCWRLYFYVCEKYKRIIYVHAVCKKKDRENPSDARRAKTVADGIQRCGSRITAFQFTAD
jgi:hypothetical protein